MIGHGNCILHHRFLRFLRFGRRLIVRSSASLRRESRPSAAPCRRCRLCSDFGRRRLALPCPCEAALRSAVCSLLPSPAVSVGRPTAEPQRIPWAPKIGCLSFGGECRRNVGSGPESLARRVVCYITSCCDPWLMPRVGALAARLAKVCRNVEVRRWSLLSKIRYDCDEGLGHYRSY